MPRRLLLVAILAVAACREPAELTEATAREVVAESTFEVEPVYAEVPQAVRWSVASPKDAYDELAIRTLRNLERAGLVALEEESFETSGSIVATTTPEGFRILGTVPSARGPAFRARIAEKRRQRIDDFVQHPSDPRTGRIEVIWTYENPTEFYDLFETKIEKPLGVPFATIVSIHWEAGGWQLRVLAAKTEA